MSGASNGNMPYGGGCGICMGARRGDGENMRRLSPDGAYTGRTEKTGNTPHVILFSGACGSGKTTFARRLFTGFKEAGIKTAYAAQQNEFLLEKESALVNIMLQDEKAGSASERDPAEEQERLAALVSTFAFEGSLHRQCNELSGGEKRVAGILRALFLIPTGGVLFLDEPTNDLDIDQTAHLIRLIESMTGVLIIIITHDDRLTGLADEILTFPLTETEEEAADRIRAAAACVGRQAVTESDPAAVKTSSRGGMEINRCGTERTSFFRKRMMKKGMFAVFYAVMALAALLACIFCYGGSDPGSGCVMPKENEIDLILPDSDYGAAALTGGAVPLKMLAALNGDLPVREKMKLLAEAQENIGKVPVNHESLMELPDEFTAYPLEYLIPEERVYINIIERYSEEYAPEDVADLSALFSAEEETFPENTVPADAVLLRNAADQTEKENPAAGITYLVLMTNENGGLSDFSGSQTCRELAETDVFIKSRETVELSELLRERTRITQTALTAAAGESVLMLIFLLSYTVVLASKKKLILIMRDAGYTEKTVRDLAGQSHRTGTVRALCIAAGGLLCVGICGGSATGAASAVLPFGAISEIFTALLCAADRIMIKTIITGDL